MIKMHQLIPGTGQGLYVPAGNIRTIYVYRGDQHLRCTLYEREYHVKLRKGVLLRFKLKVRNDLRLAL